ncbi:hypothetical protein DAPPUDRAFT_317650, partial [Olea europaea subsp. europaea]
MFHGVGILRQSRMTGTASQSKLSCCKRCCPTCGLYFASQVAMLKHMKKGLHSEAAGTQEQTLDEPRRSARIIARRQGEVLAEIEGDADNLAVVEWLPQESVTVSARAKRACARNAIRWWAECRLNEASVNIVAAH